MPNTGSPWNLPYLGYGDAPDMSLDGKAMAEAVHGYLGKARVVTSTTRPSAPTPGTFIFESDTKAYLGWDGTSWIYLSPTAAVGGATGEATFSAAVGQSIPDTTNTVVAFGTDNFTSAAVTKMAHGTGHKFRLNQSGVWSMVGVIRYATTTATGERSAEFRTVAGEFLPGDGDAPTSGSPATLTFITQQRFAANTEIFVNTWQGTGGARLLEPFTDGARVRVNFVWLRA